MQADDAFSLSPVIIMARDQPADLCIQNFQRDCLGPFCRRERLAGHDAWIVLASVTIKVQHEIRLAVLRVPPLVAPCDEHRAVYGADEIGLLAILSGPPFIIAGRRHDLKAGRNIGFSATVSARALKVERH